MHLFFHHSGQILTSLWNRANVRIKECTKDEPDHIILEGGNLTEGMFRPSLCSRESSPCNIFSRYWPARLQGSALSSISSLYA